jgi:hypothetical protein
MARFIAHKGKNIDAHLLERCNQEAVRLIEAVRGTAPLANR